MDDVDRDTANREVARSNPLRLPASQLIRGVHRMSKSAELIKSELSNADAELFNKCLDQFERCVDKRRELGAGIQGLDVMGYLRKGVEFQTATKELYKAAESGSGKQRLLELRTTQELLKFKDTPEYHQYVIYETEFIAWAKDRLLFLEAKERSQPVPKFVPREEVMFSKEDSNCQRVFVEEGPANLSPSDFRRGDVTQNMTFIVPQPFIAVQSSNPAVQGREFFPIPNRPPVSRGYPAHVPQVPWSPAPASGFADAGSIISLNDPPPAPARNLRAPQMRQTKSHEPHANMQPSGTTQYTGNQPTSVGTSFIPKQAYTSGQQRQPVVPNTSEFKRTASHDPSRQYVRAEDKDISRRTAPRSHEPHASITYSSGTTPHPGNQPTSVSTSFIPKQPHACGQQPQPAQTVPKTSEYKSEGKDRSLRDAPPDRLPPRQDHRDSEKEYSERRHDSKSTGNRDDRDRVRDNDSGRPHSRSYDRARSPSRRERSSSDRDRDYEHSRDKYHSSSRHGHERSRDRREYHDSDRYRDYESSRDKYRSRSRHGHERSRDRREYSGGGDRDRDHEYSRDKYRSSPHHGYERSRDRSGRGDRYREYDSTERYSRPGTDRREYRERSRHDSEDKRHHHDKPADPSATAQGQTDAVRHRDMTAQMTELNLSKNPLSNDSSRDKGRDRRENPKPPVNVPVDFPRVSRMPEPVAMPVPPQTSRTRRDTGQSSSRIPPGPVPPNRQSSSRPSHPSDHAQQQPSSYTSPEAMQERNASRNPPSRDPGKVKGKDRREDQKPPVNVSVDFPRVSGMPHQ